MVFMGPSQVGKTNFARSLYGPEKTIVVNCSKCVEPDLRKFDFEKHEVIVLDEAKGKMLIEMKSLMQAGPEDILLGQSGTNMHAYSVYVHRKKFIVCSNTWDHEIETLPKHDSDWLVQNAYVLHVTEPMWVE